MATYYAVNTPFTWDSTAGTKWSTSSGGASGSGPPTSADDVIFDGSSGSGAVTLGSAAVCRALTMTGFGGSVVDGGNTFTAWGNVVLHSGMTFTGAGGDWSQRGGTQFTSAGVTMPMNFLLDNAGTLALQDGMACTQRVSIESGATLSLNGQTFSSTSTTLYGMRARSGGTLALGASTATITELLIETGGTIDFGSGTLDLPGTGTVITVEAGATVTPGTGTLKVTNSSSSTKTLALGGATYPNLWLAHGSTGTVTIQGSNTFAEYKITSTTGAVLHTAGTTQTVSSIDWNGTAGNLVTVRSSSNGSAWTISKSSGAVTVDYCSIRDSTATGGATFEAEHSTNVSGNTGWTFISGFLGAPPRVSRATFVRM